MLKGAYVSKAVWLSCDVGGHRLSKFLWSNTHLWMESGFKKKKKASFLCVSTVFRALPTYLLLTQSREGDTVIISRKNGEMRHRDKAV